VAVKVDVCVADGVKLGRGEGVREALGVRLGISVWVNVREGVKVPSGVVVAVGGFVEVAVMVGREVGLGRKVELGITVGDAVDGKNRFATGSPSKAAATVEENKTTAMGCHCQRACM
jgi:hypothetical protein